MTNRSLPPSASESVETIRSWLAATIVLAIFFFSYGAPTIAAVGLKDIASDLHVPRSVPALAGSLVWFGSGFGSIGFTRLAERYGFRATTLLGAAGLSLGLVTSALAGGTQLIVAYGVLVGVFGSGAINIPLMVYVSRWFDRRRGSSLAYVTSGQYIAGTVWPSIVTLSLKQYGWRWTTVTAGAAVALAICSLASLLRKAPEDAIPHSTENSPTEVRTAASRRSVIYPLLCFAGFLCCTPMAMPSGHLVALCSDLGIAPARGALMLSVLLGSAFLSRQVWGLLADHVGGLLTILLGSICQATALTALAFTQDETGLFVVAAAFGLGFSGIIPAYVVALRQLFPAREASWRVPVWYFVNTCGMAFGGWIAGFIYDRFASYAPAFLTGVVFNLGNILVIAWLLNRQGRSSDLTGSEPGPVAASAVLVP